ncbi:hypothetical protein VRB95_08390 [Erwinia aphidicola]|uniref:hypothetical protein n=1 Tax=Erwinia aphidicola TaxID=68334 RepID=UPI0030D4BC9A
MTEIKRYDVVLVDGVPAHRPSEQGRWVKHGDLAELQDQLQRYSMSAGQVDQRKSESDAVRVALGFSADADDVAPCDLVDAIAALQEQVRALAAEKENARDVMLYAANNISYAIFNLSDKKLSDLKRGLSDTTCPTDSALLAERELRSFAARIRAGEKS